MNTMDRAAYLDKIEAVIAAGRYKDTWASLSQYETPAWYRDAKFGIFIHWGVYSVPAFGSEWYPYHMYRPDAPEFEHHLKTYGPHKDFGYKDFIPMFTAPHYDPAAWADLFCEAGARYVVPVAEHHDGFQMYQSELSQWNACDMGPRRDVLGQLKEACEERGLAFCASSHRVEHWFYMANGRSCDSDVKEPMALGDLYWPAVAIDDHASVQGTPYPTDEFLTDWLLRCCELVDKYSPRLIYFDWWIQHEAVKPYLRKFAAFYYNLAESRGFAPVICYKFDAFAFGCATVDMERGQFAACKQFPWQTDTACAFNSWGYTEGNRFKQADSILRDFVDIISKNGCLLLNIGPKADGTVTDEERQILQTIGGWMKKNGEAVYGTRPWRVAAEGPTQVPEGTFTDAEVRAYTGEDVRYTCKDGNIYAFVLRWPADGKAAFPALGRHVEAYDRPFHGVIKNVTALGYEGKVCWRRENDALHVAVPDIQGELPVAFRIEVA